MDKPKEECGVFGIFDLSGADVAHSIYYGLMALQHRGQEACGMARRKLPVPQRCRSCQRSVP